MSWLNPITDRTLQDILQKTDKGYLSYTDLNRIEGNTEYLNNKLLDYCYIPNSLVIKNNWTINDFITREHADRIRSNIKSVVISYYNIPLLKNIVFNDTFTYEQLNDIENNLYILNVWLEAMVSNFKKSGRTKSGEGGYL